MFWADGGERRCRRPHARRSRRISPGTLPGGNGHIGLDLFDGSGFAPGGRGVIGFVLPGLTPRRSRSHRLRSSWTHFLKSRRASASIVLDPPPEIEEPPASIARDLLLGDLGEGEGEGIDYDNPGMGRRRNQRPARRFLQARRGKKVLIN